MYIVYILPCNAYKQIKYFHSCWNDDRLATLPKPNIGSLAIWSFPLGSDDFRLKKGQDRDSKDFLSKRPGHQQSKQIMTFRYHSVLRCLLCYSFICDPGVVVKNFTCLINFLSSTLVLIISVALVFTSFPSGLACGRLGRRSVHGGHL